MQPSNRIEPLTLIDEIEGERTVTGFSAGAGVPDHVARRQARRALDRLRTARIAGTVAEETWDGGPASVVGLEVSGPVPTLLFALGARGKPAEQVADEAVDQVLAFVASRCPVDAHSADQLLVPLAFAEGPSRFRTSEVTRHLTTNADIVRRFTGRAVEVEGEEGEPGLVSVAGGAV